MRDRGISERGFRAPGRVKAEEGGCKGIKKQKGGFPLFSG